MGPPVSLTSQEWRSAVNGIDEPPSHPPSLSAAPLLAEHAVFWPLDGKDPEHGLLHGKVSLGDRRPVCLQLVAHIRPKKGQSDSGCHLPETAGQHQLFPQVSGHGYSFVDELSPAPVDWCWAVLPHGAREAPISSAGRTVYG